MKTIPSLEIQVPQLWSYLISQGWKRGVAIDGQKTLIRPSSKEDYVVGIGDNPNPRWKEMAQTEDVIIFMIQTQSEGTKALRHFQTEEEALAYAQSLDE